MQDHLTDVVEYRNDLERDLTAMMEADRTGDMEEAVDGLHGWALACEVWDKRPTDPGQVSESHIVEWLLTCGGPTVRLTYDTRWNHGELFHSWGADPHTGEPRDRIEVRGELCEWLAEAFGVTGYGLLI